MKRLVLEHKTGFYTSNPFTIYEPNGNIFYACYFTNKIKDGEILKFNLPAGVYDLDGMIMKMDNPVKIKKYKLPPPERHLKKKRYKIIFEPNPNKCTIHYKKGLIVFDISFKDAPLYVKYAIYFHELGHHWYKTEKLADLYAVNKMLDYGFNPSQIGRTQIFALKTSNMDRKKFIINKLTNENETAGN